MKANRTLILNTFLIVIFYSCTPENPTPNPPPTPTPTPTPTIAIGENYQGGKIAYIDASGIHGLIAAPSDQGMADWGCLSTPISGADGTEMFTGKYNTNDIINGCPTTGIAARLCGDLVLGGYSDWYLPSKDELNQLYINRYAIGGFANIYYWSSTEYGQYDARRQDFSNGFQFYTNKANNDAVRAVRIF